MALINCPECSAEVSEQAAVCIKCGYDISTNIIMKQFISNKNSEYFTSGEVAEDIKQVNKSNLIPILIISGISIAIGAIGFSNRDVAVLIAVAFIFFIVSAKIFNWIHTSKGKSALRRLSKNLSTIYPVFNQTTNLSNFKTIKSNEKIEANEQEFLIALMYVKAYELGADAIVTGDISSQTSTYTTQRIDRGPLGIGSASVKNDVHSSTTNYLTATYLKYNKLN